MTRTLVVTAANEAFVPLLRGLVKSLYQWKSQPFTDLACFDLGLDKESGRWIGSHARHVVEPEWDLPVDPEVRMAHPEFRGLTVRPFLRDYFPGYDVYLWLDADTWVQERFALEACVAGAVVTGLAIAPQSHPAYRDEWSFFRQRVSYLQAYFGGEAARSLHSEPYFNAGVFALAAGARHWAVWAKWFRAGLETAQGKLVTDQAPLNYAIWTEPLPVTVLSALCNWCCHLATPRFDQELGSFCEPGKSGRPIGILHLTAFTKGNLSLRFQVSHGPARSVRGARGHRSTGRRDGQGVGAYRGGTALRSGRRGRWEP